MNLYPTGQNPTGQSPRVYKCETVQHVQNAVIPNPPDGKSWKTITPKLSETSPDVILADLNEAGIKNELNRPSSGSPLILYLELKALYDANPSHKIVIKGGEHIPHFNGYVLESIYKISRVSQREIKPVLCELPADKEDLIKNRHRMGDYVEIYPDEASAVEALKDK